MNRQKEETDMMIQGKEYTKEDLIGLIARMESRMSDNQLRLLYNASNDIYCGGAYQEILPRAEVLEQMAFNSDEECECCFCGKKIRKDHSNNPSPVNQDPEARCCCDCNQNIVIPARIYLKDGWKVEVSPKGKEDLKELSKVLKEYASIYNALQEADNLFDKADDDIVTLAGIRDHMESYLNEAYHSEDEYQSFFSTIMIALNKVLENLLQDFGDDFEQWRLKLKEAGVRK